MRDARGSGLGAENAPAARGSTRDGSGFLGAAAAGAQENLAAIDRKRTNLHASIEVCHRVLGQLASDEQGSVSR